LKLAAFRNPKLQPRQQLADSVRVDITVALERNQRRCLRLSVDLFQIYAERTEKPKRIGPERRASRHRPSGKTQPEQITYRTVNHPLTQAVGEFDVSGNRLAVTAEPIA